MAIVLDKYAIKEVADVMFYELDSQGAPSAPVLYLDTLKTSTLSQSSETVDARGGKGNVKILSWDTNKELTIEMEDAVFSAKSLQIMVGGDMVVTDDKQEVLKTFKTKGDNGIKLAEGETDYLTFRLNGNDYYIDTDLVTAFSYNDATTKGSEKITINNVEYTLGIEVDKPVAVAVPDWENMIGSKAAAASNARQRIEFVTFDLLDCTSNKAARGDSNGVVKGGMTINIGAEFGSNTYYITGDTYARNVASGKDEFLQFIIPKGKVSAEDVSLTMEADGDPATFAMTVQCLKSESGSMVKLVKYALTNVSGDSGDLNKGVASVLDEFEDNHANWADPVSKVTDNTSQIVSG